MFCSTVIGLALLVAGAGEPVCPVAPPAPAVDLRSMLRTHITADCRGKIASLDARRRALMAQKTPEAWRGVRARVLADMGDLRFPEPVSARLVSRHERPGYVVENVLFESLPGWEVNASVYLPDARTWAPPWPAIIVPVGHSSKTGESYQIPAQVFARLGYVAVTFDPPGMGGEKQGHNDHFVDGVRCYLTGWSSNRFFVADALRCVDYVASRPDVDMRHGVGMTGVSGGGYTTMFAALLDGRIAAAGPSCTAAPNLEHPILDAYAPCAETLIAGRFDDGYDDTDLLAAAVPTPMLLMAGAQDEVFKGTWSDAIAAEAGAAYGAAGMGERFRYFSDPGGHAYTVAMARAFVEWMDKWVRQEQRPLPAITREELEMAPPELLRCGPRLDVDMFSINRDRAMQLRMARRVDNLAGAVGETVHATSAMPVPASRGAGRKQVWFHWLEELMLAPSAGIELPATFLYPMREGWRGPALLYFDERGRWTDLRQQGPLAELAGFINKETQGPAILSVDVRGWGDTRAADGPYDLASWGGSGRWLAYVSAASGDGVLAMRVRDGLAALAYLRGRMEVDGARILVGGRGMGAAVALQVAAIDGQTAGVFCVEGLASFESLATSVEYRWQPEDFLPNVLLRYDLPELASYLAGCSIPVLAANPLDAMRRPMDAAAAAAVYGAEPPTALRVLCDVPEAAVWREVRLLAERLRNE